MYSSYTILGFGKTAISTVNFLLANDKKAKIRVSELKNREDFDLNLLQDLESQGLEFEFTQQSQEFICQDKDSFIVISPGIPPSSEIIQIIKDSGIDHGTDFDLFSMFLSDEHNYAAITGTNGKTTTVSLLASIFNNQALGNIGKPFLDFQEQPGTNFACEISSFQLYHSHFFAEKRIPKIAIHLNLSPDHLDWHSDLLEYQESKEKLFLTSEKEENFWLLNFDDPKIKNFALDAQAKFSPETKTKILWFSKEDISFSLSESTPLLAYQKYNTLFLAKYLGDGQSNEDQNGMISVNANNDYYLEIPLAKIDELNLVGAHNYANILAASLAAFALGFDADYISEQIKNFKAVPHRLEFVAEIDGNKFYNDSKATNPDSAIKAIQAFDHVIVILGGKDKQLDLNPFLKQVSKRAFAVIAIGELKNKIYQILTDLNFEKVRRAETLEEAVRIAMNYSDNNTYPILLSPASSSFDMFKSYEDRGEQFKSVIASFTGHNC